MPKAKRSYSTESEEEDMKPLLEDDMNGSSSHTPPPSSQAKVKKVKSDKATFKTTPKKSKTASSTTFEGIVSPSKGIGAFPIEAKKVLLQKTVELAYRGLPYAELAQELGISESRLKDQFKPGRSNLRKMILELLP